MSMYPCLPVPRKRSRRGGASTGGRNKRQHQRRRRGKDQEGQDEEQNKVEASMNEHEVDDEVADDGDDDEDGGTHKLSGAKTIDSLQKMDAMEYILSVSQEAKAYPETVEYDDNADGDANEAAAMATTATQQQCRRRKTKKESFVPIDGCAADIQYLLQLDKTHSTLTEQDDVSNNLRPGPEWIQWTLTSFRNLRSYVQSRGSQDRKRLVPLPKLSDRQGWNMVCLGPDEAKGNVGGYYDDDEEDDDEKTEDGNGEEIDDLQLKGENDNDKNNFVRDYHKPTVSLLLQMDQVMTRRVLRHLIQDLLDSWPLSERRCEWMYALLAHLEEPQTLHRDTLADLSSLRRELLQRRQQESSCARIDTLLVVVGDYFGQGKTLR